jgi:hypothetical protein
VALLSIKRDVDIVPGVSAPVVFHVSQNDVGTNVILSLLNYGTAYNIPQDTTVTIIGSASNGNVFNPVNATYSGSDVTFRLSEEMSSVAGPALCEAVLVLDDNALGTANFIINVEASPMGADVPPVFTDAAWDWMLGKFNSEIIPEFNASLIDAIDSKLDMVFPTDLSGKYLKINSTGHVEPSDIEEIPVDATLSHEGEAADAKATGDALALKANKSTIAPEFDTSTSYTAGSYVYKNGVLYRFTSAHTGTWTGTDVEVVTVGGEVTDLKADLNDIINDGTTHLPESAFVLGSLNVNTGGIINGFNYRCATNKSLVYTRDITITPKSGYRFYLLYMTGDTVSQALGWQTNNFIIPANQEFRIVIAKVTEDTSSTANIPAYVDALSVLTYISNLEKRVEKIENNEYFEPVEVQSANVFDKSNTDLILTGKIVNSNGDVSDSANFSVIKIPVNGIDGNEYNLYLPNTGNTGYIAASTRFAMYDANGSKIGLIVNGTADPAVITDDRCRYLYIPMTSVNIDKAMVLINANGATLPIYLPIPYKKHFVYDLHWHGKGWSSYGDSISAINNGDFIGKGWAGIVNYECGFSKFHGRSVGGQTFKWGTGGGAVTFVKANGDYYDRNGNYNLDNYDGSVPSGCKAVRGCMCSWIKIKEMYPESIKDDVNMVFIMAGSNDTYTADEELVWIENDTTDPEWASSEEYASANDTLLQAHA